MQRNRCVAKRNFRCAHSLLLLLALALLVGFGFWRAKNAGPPPKQWQGYAEADFVKVGPTQQGLLTTLDVARGDRSRRARRCSRRTIPKIAPRATRRRASSNRRRTNSPISRRRQADGNRAGRGQSRRCARHARSAPRPISRAARTCCRAAPSPADRRPAPRRPIARPQATWRRCEAALAQARAPLGRDARDRRRSGAAVAAAKAALGMAEWRLAQRSVTAPAAGRIADVLARPGETMAAGAPVVSLLPPRQYLRALLRSGRRSRDHASRRQGRDRLRRLPARFDRRRSLSSRRRPNIRRR